MRIPTIAEVLPQLSEAQLESLRQAGVTSLEALARAEVAQLAEKAQLPKEQVEEWKKRAQTALAPTPPRRGLTWGQLGWLLAAVLFLVSVIGLSVMGRRVHRAEQMRIQAETKLVRVVSQAAEQALVQARAAQQELAAQNWGTAQERLTDVGLAVNYMEEMAPASVRAGVQRVRAQLGDTQTAVGAQSQDAADRLTRLVQLLEELAGKTRVVR